MRGDGPARSDAHVHGRSFSAHIGRADAARLASVGLAPTPLHSHSGVIL